MKRKLFKVCSHTTLITMEVLAALVGLLVVSLAILIWRLSSGPLDVGFARDYIEDALRDPVSGYSVTVEDVVLEWPDLAGPLLLELGTVDLLKGEESVLTIRQVNLGLSKSHLLVGRIVPVSIFLAEPSLHLIRTTENKVRLSIEEENGEPEKQEENGEEPLMRVINMLSRSEADVDDRSPLAHLQSFEISNARTVIEDHVLGITWYISDLGVIFARDERGLAISTEMSLPGTGQDSRIAADIIYGRDDPEFSVGVHIKALDPHILSRKIEQLAWLNPHDLIIDGEIELTVGRDLSLHRVTLETAAREGALALEGVYDEPLTFENMKLKADYDHQKKILDLQDLSMQSAGVLFSVASTIDLSGDVITAPMTLKIPDLPQEKIEALWPDVLNDEPVRIWLTQKMTGGRYYDASLSLDMKAQEQEEGEWNISANNITAEFAVEKMDIDYRPPLLPVKQIVGKGHFENDILTIDISEGKLASLDVSKASVRIDHIIAEGVGNADIHVDLAGPLRDVFRYIALEPINMKDALEVDTGKIKGRADLAVDVSLPTSRDVLFEQVKVGVKGTLSDVLLPGLVRGLDVTGGPLALSVADGGVTIEGKAKLDNRPVDVKWFQYLELEGKPFSSTVQARLRVDKALRHHFGVEIEDWMEGTPKAKVIYTEHADGRSEALIEADVGDISLMAKPFDFVKKPGEEGTAQCKVNIKNGFIQNVENLAITSKRVRVEKARLDFETVGQESLVSKGSFPRLVLDETDVALDFEMTRERLMKMKVKGAFLDIRPFLVGKRDKNEPYTGPPLMASINVDRMRTHPTRLVEKVNIYADVNRKGILDQLEMDAVAGEGVVYFRLKPKEDGTMYVRLEADDAGAVLRAFNIYENVKGGKLLVYGTAQDKAHPYILGGTAELQDFNVVNAPALAQLLNAISPTGLPQLLSGEGLYFTKLEADFAWYRNRAGDIYNLSEGRTSGASLGLTFEGQIDKQKDYMKIKGHIVPMSALNSLVSNIPLIGDILAGGSGGAIIAATYSIEGETKSPKTSVNPLSVLTPGILRKLLFESGE